MKNLNLKNGILLFDVRVSVRRRVVRSVGYRLGHPKHVRANPFFFVRNNRGGTVDDSVNNTKYRWCRRGGAATQITTMPLALRYQRRAERGFGDSTDDEDAMTAR